MIQLQRDKDEIRLLLSIDLGGLDRRDTNLRCHFCRIYISEMLTKWFGGLVVDTVN